HRLISGSCIMVISQSGSKVPCAVSLGHYSGTDRGHRSKKTIQSAAYRLLMAAISDEWCWRHAVRRLMHHRIFNVFRSIPPQ
ncbi:MAG: hypothetical protein O2981_03995, partial [Proteobacteria bacterium]|nr:hypothetical protein [Pseudomonadota bacterium]